MKKLRELKNVEILYDTNYHDGSLRGLCRYKGRIYWFDILNMGDFEATRKWKVFKIIPWQLTYELYWHSLFCTNVAQHTNFEKNLINKRFKLDEDFYEKRKREFKEIDYNKNKVIGWFKK